MSAFTFGYNSQGPKAVRVVFQPESDKHAAFSASKGLKADRIYLDDDLTVTQTTAAQKSAKVPCPSDST